MAEVSIIPLQADWKGTLTLDKSSHALAVLAWRKGMTRKRFYSLAVMHALSREVRSQASTALDGRRLTIKQAQGVKKRR